MTLEDIMEMSAKDIKLDDVSLDIESLRTPLLFDKYLKIVSLLSRQENKLKKEYNILKRDKILYYTGRSDPEVYKENPFDLKVIKNELDVWLNADEDLSSLQEKIDEFELKCNYVERTMKNILERQWHIKNVIEWRKFTSGV